MYDASCRAAWKGQNLGGVEETSGGQTLRKVIGDRAFWGNEMLPYDSVMADTRRYAFVTAIELDTTESESLHMKKNV